MTTSSLSSIKKELAALPIARIETMDQSYTLPLREYLFTNGCQVFVNSGPTENVTYLFIAGDSNFVKKTLAFRHGLGKKQLIICWDYEDHESIQQFLGRQSKVVFLDPVLLTSSVITEIFTFLFTAKGTEMDLQKQYVKNTLLDPILEHNTNLGVDDIQEVEPESKTSLYTHSMENIHKNHIEKTIQDMFGKRGTPQTSVANRNASTIKNKSDIFSHIIVGISLTVFVLLAPFLLYIGSFCVRGWLIVRAAENFKTGKGTLATKNIRGEQIWSGYSHLSMPIVHGILRLPLGERTIQAYERIDALLDIITEVESELLTVNEAVLAMSSSLLLEKNTDSGSLSPIVATDTIRKAMPGIKNRLDLASAYLKSCNDPSIFPFSFPFIKTKLDKAAAQLVRLRQISEVGERISQLYPFVGGFREKQRVLVLLQNSSELRPTGGFIGSLAHLTISEGSLEDIRIEDIYTLDGQLKGHVDPPAPIRDLLSQEHWYMRDSNWNPDFSKTAQQVKFFYEKETGEQVESIVGVTSSFVVNVLRVMGQVDIPFFNDRITADNFYLKSLYYTQENFFPGSSQKKDFLGALMEALLTKLQKSSQSGVAIMGIIHDSLLSRDIQIYTTHPEGQQAIVRFGWGGVVPAGAMCLTLENQPPCVFSYVHINEANLSVNKVNAFIDRSQTRSIQISEEGKISETITRKIQNLSQGESGTGVYTSYVRIFFPSGGILTTLMLDGKPVDMKNEKLKIQTLPYGELDLTLPDLTGVGVALEVAPGRERVLSATVSHKETILNTGKEASLTVFEQKQAGVDALPATTIISFPPAWDAVMTQSTKIDGIVAKKGYLQYNTILSEDSEFSFRLLR